MIKNRINTNKTVMQEMRDKKCCKAYRKQIAKYRSNYFPKQS